MFQRKTDAPADDTPSIHYVLAHYALRQVALENPLRFLAAIGSPEEGPQLIGAVVESVCQQFDIPNDFPLDQIRVHPRRIKDYPCAIIELPEPTEMAEAYFVAIVALIDGEFDLSVDAPPAPARYFTLEKGFSVDDAPRTVLAEWKASAHSNFGDGPEPTPEKFAASIEQLLS